MSLRTPKTEKIEKVSYFSAKDLIPDYAPSSLTTSQSSSTLFNEIYVECHENVFQSTPPHPKILKENKDTILNTCRALKRELNIYLTSVMVGHALKNSDIPFPYKTLYTEYGAKSSVLYMNLASENYGNITQDSLLKLLPWHKNLKILSKDFELSEKLIACDIVSKCLLHEYESNSFLVYNSFNEKECQLSPEWLAINPVYLSLPMEVFTKKESHILSRNNVLRIRKQCARRPSVAKKFYVYYEDTLLPTLYYILDIYNIAHNTLEFTDKTVTNSVKFWLSVGKAIRQIEIIKAVNNKKSCYSA